MAEVGKSYNCEYCDKVVAWGVNCSCNSSKYGRGLSKEFVLNQIIREYTEARKRFLPMRGPHEGYAVILEELDEMWDAIKANNLEHARKECLQVAAMALAFLLEVKE